jgi:hypothetical protein
MTSNKNYKINIGQKVGSNIQESDVLAGHRSLTERLSKEHPVKKLGVIR